MRTTSGRRQNVTVERIRREFGRRARFLAGRMLWATGLVPVPPRTWVLGGFVGAAFADNSAALFRYLRRERPDIHAVWTIRSDAADAGRARAHGPIVDHAGVDSAALAAGAEVLIVSHGLHDVPGFASTSSALRVRLGHGLTALKRTKPPSGRTALSTAQLYDVVPVASEFERSNKEQWCIPPERMPICGLCRFDDLIERSRRAAPERRVVYVPTWREWVADGRIENDAGVWAIVSLLGSRALHDVLERYDLAIDVVAHRMLGVRVRAALASLATERVSVHDGNVDMQAILARSVALMTDYSGVTWDMLYLDRPVLFFQPDLERYQMVRGSYIDLQNDLPGEATLFVDDAPRMLCRAAESGFALSERARAWQKRAFAFRDDRNCARVVAAIESSLQNRRHL